MSEDERVLCFAYSHSATIYLHDLSTGDLLRKVDREVVDPSCLSSKFLINADASMFVVHDSEAPIRVYTNGRWYDVMLDQPTPAFLHLLDLSRQGTFLAFTVHYPRPTGDDTQMCTCALQLPHGVGSSGGGVVPDDAVCRATLVPQVGRGTLSRSYVDGVKFQF